MNWKTWVPLALAVVLGLAAMKIARDVMARRSSVDAGPRDLTQMVVMKTDLPAGSPLRAEHLAVGKMTGDVAPEAVFRDISQLEGRVVREPVFRGQPVLEALLTPRGTGTGLQALVPKGMRAITVEINEFSGIAGFLVPGCRVDVVSTINGDNGEMISRTIVQNVKVSALGQRRQNEGGADATELMKSVTLLVTPKEAEAVELASATGRPRLVLRSSGDESRSSSEGITVAELRGGKARRSDPFSLPVELLRTPVPATQPVAVTPVALDESRPLRTVRIIRGGVESHVTMEVETTKGPKWMTDAK